LLEQEGRWALTIESMPDVPLLKAMRECLSLSMAETQELRAQLPGVLASGTHCEMRVLAAQMTRSAGDRSIQIVRADSE
jgi:hypothetical protein